MGDVLEVLKPLLGVGTAMGAIVGGAFVAILKYKPMLRQNFRDEQMAKDFEALAEQNKLLQANYAALVAHDTQQSSDVRSMANSVRQLSSIVESMANLFPTLSHESNPALGTLLVLVAQFQATAEDLREQAETVISRADEDVIRARERADFFESLRHASNKRSNYKSKPEDDEE